MEMLMATTRATRWAMGHSQSAVGNNQGSLIPSALSFSLVSSHLILLSSSLSHLHAYPFSILGSPSLRPINLACVDLFTCRPRPAASWPGARQSTSARVRPASAPPPPPPPPPIVPGRPRRKRAACSHCRAAILPTCCAPRPLPVLGRSSEASHVQTCRSIADPSHRVYLSTQDFSSCPPQMYSGRPL
ncbi:hypothetical protein CC85DRAFT_17629 [Cutaneotrichosporon oleaginosum]|uniref:Uncharacterized protein n=1 Tax=Cutaneotrichosporon oleaginosum TaxID=879819 RepID=A0A0J0XTK8_9TREE|nr:uncharacterized protein CC85DRAFT_17629 [Cutaneotrichosporon oleaginosum]KLT44408.1 hypothetical protein CC85DRAFT_17629 [Cutaneotrichosporon oleaginosum]TXT07871.1 hypothetical protein COLE_04795 [Cutaneotrichosporon oleaginosum]